MAQCIIVGQILWFEGQLDWQARECEEAGVLQEPLERRIRPEEGLGQSEFDCHGEFGSSDVREGPSE